MTAAAETRHSSSCETTGRRTFSSCYSTAMDRTRCRAAPTYGYLVELQSAALNVNFRSVRICLDVVLAACAEAADGGKGIFHELNI